jgi:hypothetical protein
MLRISAPDHERAIFPARKIVRWIDTNNKGRVPRPAHDEMAGVERCDLICPDLLKVLREKTCGGWRDEEWAFLAAMNKSLAQMSKSRFGGVDSASGKPGHP